MADGPFMENAGVQPLGVCTCNTLQLIPVMQIFLLQFLISGTSQ